MAYNLLPGDREQGYLMAPSVREWLSEGQLAWFLVDAVGQIDRSEFYAAYRRDGWVAAADDPEVMVAIVLHAYCLGLPSSRRIARGLEEDMGFRVVAANQSRLRSGPVPGGVREGVGGALCAGAQVVPRGRAGEGGGGGPRRTGQSRLNQQES